METQLYSFACAPSTHTDMSGTEVSPIPTKNFTIPARSIKREVLRMLMDGVPTKLRYGAMLPGCWLIVRDLVCGSWVALVSKDQYCDLGRNNTRWELRPMAIYPGNLYQVRGTLSFVSRPIFGWRMS